MAALGPVEQTLRVFETIDAHFKANPALLNTDGIFRISSAGRKHIDLAEAIQNNHKIDWSQYSAHDCANALKYVLLQVKLLPATDKRVELFMAQIQDAKRDPNALKQLINSLHNTEDELNVAAILNIGLDICRRTTIQEKYNRMSPTNLAVVWGPAFQHCLNMEPKGNDLMAQVFFTMNQLNPAVEECIVVDLPKVVPAIVDLKRRTITNAADLYKVSQAMLTFSGQKLAQLRQQQIELQNILEVKMSLLKKGGLTRTEKKELKKNTIPTYHKELAELEMQLENWKKEAKRHLITVTEYNEHSIRLTASFDRLEVMLSEITPSGSDEERSVELDTDELFNHSPIMTVQYGQQDSENTAEDALEHAPTTAERVRAATR